MESDPKAETLHRLLTTANLQRMRGDLSAAMATCQEVLQADPENATALDLMGDLLAQKGELDAAMEHYQKAFKREPRAATEEKIARLALRIQAEKERSDTAPAWEPGISPQRRLNPSVACGLSMLFPGLGQLYNGQHVKGFVLFGGWLGCIVAFGTLVAPHYRAIRYALMGSVGEMGAGPPVPPWVWALLAFMAIVWAYALIDASLTANSINRGLAGGGKTGWEV
jgi:tetratricopeptide (TPR) repeat protein